MLINGRSQSSSFFFLRTTLFPGDDVNCCLGPDKKDLFQPEDQTHSWKVGECGGFQIIEYLSKLQIETFDKLEQVSSILSVPLVGCSSLNASLKIYMQDPKINYRCFLGKGKNNWTDCWANDTRSHSSWRVKFSNTSPPKKHVYGQWEEAEVAEENPRNTQTTKHPAGIWTRVSANHYTTVLPSVNLFIIWKNNC